MVGRPCLHQLTNKKQENLLTQKKEVQATAQIRRFCATPQPSQATTFNQAKQIQKYEGFNLYICGFFIYKISTHLK